MTDPSPNQLGRGLMIGRALRLRCPLCGKGRLYRRWFLMNKACPHCDFKLEREPGYYLGSIYINYGLTAVLMTAGYFVGFFTRTLPPQQLLWVCLAFAVLFPLWFFPYSRALWLAFDLGWDPPVDRQQAAGEKTDGT